MLDFFSKMVRRLVLTGGLVAAALALSAHLPAVAQEPSKVITEATLQLWPEYDDPGLLVIYAGEFAGTLQFPLEVEFPVPNDARGIQATSRETDGRLMTQEWQIRDGRLVYTLPGPGFHIEYYLDQQPSGDQREINFAFETPYAVDSLNIRAQHPASATDYLLTPTEDGSIVGDDGFTYSLLNKKGLKPDEKIDMVIRYNKAGQGVSRPAVATTQIAPVPQPSASQEAAAGADFAAWLPYLLIGIGLAALVGATLYWILRARVMTTAEPVKNAPRSSKPARPLASTGERVEERTFCTKCGRQFGAEDSFCAKCGTPRVR